MKNKFCIKCGKSISPMDLNCVYCHTPVGEMNLSMDQQIFIETIEKYNVENPPSKVKGCLATLVVFGLIFGLPGLLAYSGIGIDSFLGLTISAIILIGLNILIFKYRSKLAYKHKSFYKLSKKPKAYFESLQVVCRECKQEILTDMSYCPNCGLYVHEDLPLDLSGITNEKNTRHKCRNCGSAIYGKKFCPDCGTKVEVM